MKYDPEKSFGYPVLSVDNDDYIKSSFQTSFTFDVNNENPKEFKLEYSFLCGVKGILDLISTDHAGYRIKVSCRDTFYSRMHSVPREGVLRIEGSMLRGVVEFAGLVIANRESEVQSDKINPEFGFKSFTVNNGQVLAQAPPRVYVTDKEFWKPISSIFEYRKMDDLKDGEFTVDLEDEFIQILSNSSQLQKFKQFEKSTDGKIVLVNSVFFVAVAKMIEVLAEKPDDYENKKWARILQAKAASKKIDLQDPKMFVAAQQLLGRPLGQLTAAILEK